MSHALRTALVRNWPRWSILPTAASLQMAGSAAPIAALPWPSAIVCVGPVLSASGPRRGFAGRAKPQGGVADWRLLPSSVIVPAQLLPLLPDTMVLATVTVPPPEGRVEISAP